MNLETTLTDIGRARQRRLVATNLNNILKKTIIKLAAEVAGLSFAKDVIVEF